MDKVKPVTIDEIDEELKAVASKAEDKKALDNIFVEFKRSLMSLINNVELQTIHEDEKVQLKRLKRITGLAPAYEVFMRTKEKIWASREQLLHRNADFFLKEDFSHLVKRDERQTMIESLINIIRSMYERLTDEQRDFYWCKALEMLKFVVDYRKLIR